MIGTFFSSRAAVLAFAVASATYAGACARSGDSSTKSAAAAPAGSSAASAAALAAPASPGAATHDSVSTLADRSRIQGDSSAKTWMVIVSDFQCPYCRLWHDSTYRAVVNEYVRTGKLRVAYVNFPLPTHQNAWPAAEAVMCSGVQGKFWEMHDKVFDTQERWAGMANPAPFFDSLATTVGVDPKRLQACVSSHATRPLIQADYDRSSRAGVNSTPSFIIGQQVIAGAFPADTFRKVLDAALAKQ